jgi:hypothetical protein
VANVQTAPTVKEANSLKLEHLAILTKDSTTVNPALEEGNFTSIRTSHLIHLIRREGKRSGGGRGNWGTVSDETKPAEEG